MPRHPTTDVVRRHYERLADRYDRSAEFCERLIRVEAGRRWLGSRASGDTLEIGVGTGLNILHYRPEVRLTGMDLSARMLALARRRAEDLGRAVDLVVGDAQAMAFPDRSFDTVVFGLCLCSIPDDRRAVEEGARVLKPGGRMLLLEHVASPNALVRAGQRLLEPLAVRFQADHLTREPLDHVRARGLVIEEVHRWAWGIMERVEARKSGAADNG
jgi:ubiquinone/menaquinone biosynthesis C-methylase UbiE